MDEMKLDRELGNYDFSQNHPIRETLKERLLNMHRMDNRKSVSWGGRLNDAELDYAVAAGSIRVKKDEEDSEEKMK